MHSTTGQQSYKRAENLCLLCHRVIAGHGCGVGGGIGGAGECEGGGGDGGGGGGCHDVIASRDNDEIVTNNFNSNQATFIE